MSIHRPGILIPILVLCTVLISGCGEQGYKGIYGKAVIQCELFNDKVVEEKKFSGKCISDLSLPKAVINISKNYENSSEDPSNWGYETYSGRASQEINAGKEFKFSSSFVDYSSDLKLDSPLILKISIFVTTEDDPYFSSYSNIMEIKIQKDPTKAKAEVEWEAAQKAADANEQIAKNSYDEGYAFIWENSAEFLVTMPGLLTSFDIKGNPIKREMNEFCKSLYSETLIARGYLTSSKDSARKEWNKGCFQAVMKITLSDLNKR